MQSIRLTSLQNPLLKSIRRAAARGKPTDEGLYIAEGPHLLEEALRSAWSVEKILATELAFEKHEALLARTDAEQIEISAEALSAIADTETSQELLTLLRPRGWSWDDLLGGLALLVVLDGIQDPGNAGAIVRSAEAFGATGVVFLKGSVRVFNPKFLRASAGSIFRMPFLETVEGQSFLKGAREAGVVLCALSPKAKTGISQANLVQPLALAVGSEGSGLSPEIAAASEPFAIPTRKVESLNAAVSVSIALFEAYKQRGAHEPV
ncbi:MAG: TrmH family RNA methyltransferase [Bryobacteraceae bacterium]